MSKRFIGEAVGTFGVIFSPLLLSAFSQAGSGGLLNAALVSGLAVTCMIAIFGPMSTAHFNPAVTLGFAAANRLPLRQVVPTIVAQFAGTVLAALCCLTMGHPSSGGHTPAPSVSVLGAVLIEAFITGILMVVILATATDGRCPWPFPAVLIGSAVSLGVLVAGSATGGSMNPFRSLAPALVAPTLLLGHWWIYLVGPCIGSVVGAIGFEKLRIASGFSSEVPGEAT